MAGFGINRPILLASQVSLEACRRYHCAAETQFGDGTAQFLNRLFRLLQRNQRQTLESRAFLEIGITEPVVPGTCDIDGELAGNDFAECETTRSVKHRPFNSHIVHKLYPAIHTDLAEGAGDQLEQTRGMKMVQRRKDSSAKPAALYVRLRHVL